MEIFHLGLLFGASVWRFCLEEPGPEELKEAAGLNDAMNSKTRDTRLWRPSNTGGRSYNQER